MNQVNEAINNAIYKCKGCKGYFLECDGDHILHCEGEGWKVERDSK